MAAEAPIDQAARRGSPLRAFLIAASIVVAASSVAIWFLAPNPASDVKDLVAGAAGSAGEPAPVTQILQSLKKIDAARHEALERRNPDLLRSVFAPSSPALERVERSIRRLQSDRVRLVVDTFEVLSARVVRIGDQEAITRQVAIVDYDFVGRDGRSLDAGSPERQVLRSTLRQSDGLWLFFDGRIVSAERVLGVE